MGYTTDVDDGDFERTPRGFAIYARLRDRIGTAVRVQQSGAADEDCVWIFSTDMIGKERALHLSVEQAAALHAGLGRWLEEFGGEAVTKGVTGR